jgi:glucosylceramidase
MRKKSTLFFITLTLSVLMTTAYSQQVTTWLTDPAKNILFKKQSKTPSFKSNVKDSIMIMVDDEQTYQSMDGFGFALTGGSAQHLMKMNRAARTALLKELFDTTGTNIGTSYLRISIGASDLNDHVFSYDDMPAGQTDTSLSHFDLGPDRLDVIPVLKEIFAINPGIKILGSPWSAPVWMKSNGDTRGGSLLPAYYAAYAKYFVRYIQDMEKEGIHIDAITVQNEPLHPGNNPSMYMLAADQAIFIKEQLGPAFRQAGLTTRIIVYDHNADRPDYPLTILNDPDARQYVDGSAFHLYAGNIDTLSSVHDAYPDKNLYFTEQWVGAPGSLKRDIPNHIRTLIVGAVRNWCRTVIEWNLSSDSLLKPYTDRGGCNRCLGAVTINKNKVTRNPAYYIIAHAAKYVRPGSVRIASANTDNLLNIAFKRPDGKIVLIVLNNSKQTKSFGINFKKKTFTTTLVASAVATYVW